MAAQDFFVGGSNGKALASHKAEKDEPAAWQCEKYLNFMIAAKREIMREIKWEIFFHRAMIHCWWFMRWQEHKSSLRRLSGAVEIPREQEKYLSNPQTFGGSASSAFTVPSWRWCYCHRNFTILIQHNSFARDGTGSSSLLHSHHSSTFWIHLITTTIFKQWWWWCPLGMTRIAPYRRRRHSCFDFILRVYISGVWS